VETVMQSEFYLKEDIDRILEELQNSGKYEWGQIEAAKNVGNLLRTANIYSWVVQRELK